MEKRIRQKLMIQQSFQEHKAFREIQKQRQKEEDQAFRETMMAKFAEDDRIEQMNARKRRMKQLEHRHEVEKLIEDKRRQREAEEVRITTCQLHQYQDMMTAEITFLLV